MKNTAINTLTYTGIVTLSQYTGQEKLKIAQAHNEGGSSLFDFLASCLAGDFEQARPKIPAKIRLLNRISQEDGDDFKPISGFIYKSGDNIISVSGQSRIRYSFMVSRDLVENITDFSTLGLGLYSNNASDSEEDAKKYVAFCSLDIPKHALLRASLVVDWDLVIANAGSTITY